MYNCFIFIVPGTGFEPAHPCERCDRTSTSLRTLRPEHSASTNFATRAIQGLQI